MSSQERGGSEAESTQARALLCPTASPGPRFLHCPGLLMRLCQNGSVHAKQLSAGAQQPEAVPPPSCLPSEQRTPDTETGETGIQ